MCPLWAPLSLSCGLEQQHRSALSMGRGVHGIRDSTTPKYSSHNILIGMTQYHTGPRGKGAR